MRNRIFWQFGIAIPLALAGVTATTSGNHVLAQLTPDDSLGAERSTVTTQQLVDLIRGGAIRDSALFHSFEDFNVGDGRSVLFDLQNNTDILNIFTRVTGSSSSQILGTLGVLNDLGNANLFLLNPNGITFGANASLQLNGSFFATTADGFGFDNFTFSASGQEAPPPLLTVSIPRSINFRDNPGNIVNQSIVPSTINPDVFDGLRVPDRQSLVLVGGDVNLEGGSLRAPGGRIEIGSLAEAGNVGINVDGSSINLSFPDGLTRGDVSLTALENVFPDVDAIPEIDVTAGGGGDIAIYARNINILGGSGICAGIGADGACGELAQDFGSPDAQAGDILLDAQETITIANQVSVVNNQVNFGAFGNAGDINIQTGSLFVNDGGQLNNASLGQGNAGNINILANDQVSVANSGSQIFNFLNANSFGSAGSISINANTLNLQDNAIIAVFTNGQGDTGDLFIQADDSVNISNGGFLTNQVNQGIGNSGDITIQTSQLSITENGLILADTFGQGSSGNITIETGSFIATNSGQISASVSGVGDSGKVTINATDTVSFDGRDENDSFPSGVFASVNAGGEGNTGGIEINANTVRVTNRAQLLSTTIGIGDPGDIVINARDQVFLQDSIFISEVTEPNDDGVGGVGNAGNIIITAGSLILQDGSSLLADTENIGDAGDIIINVRDEVILEGTGRSSFSGSTDIVPSQITSTVDSVNQLAIGEGGDINISAGSLLLTDGGFIRTSTFGQGNAGDLTINVDDSVTVTNDGFIAASNQNETTGAAGDLLINADSIFLNNSASLQATTQTGEQGNITLNAEGVILSRGSFISTDASGTSTGGNITINAGVLAGLENSDITSNSVGGEGGLISINAEGVFGLQIRDELTEQSDITAFSELGAQFSGQVIFNTPETNHGQENIEPPEEVVDSSEIVAQTACYDFGGDSQLANSGRGGLPQIPGFTIRNDTVDVDLVDEVLPAPPPEAIKPHHRTTVTFTDSEGEEFKPAMGAVLLPNGMVQFVDYNPAEVYRDMYVAAGCSR